MPRFDSHIVQHFHVFAAKSPQNTHQKGTAVVHCIRRVFFLCVCVCVPLLGSSSGIYIMNSTWFGKSTMLTILSVYKSVLLFSFERDPHQRIFRLWFEKSISIAVGICCLNWIRMKYSCRFSFVTDIKLIKFFPLHMCACV